LLDIVDQHPPQTSVAFLQQIGNSVDGHLGAQEHDKSFHHQGKTAAFRAPREPAPDGPGPYDTRLRGTLATNSQKDAVYVGFDLEQA